MDMKINKETLRRAREQRAWTQSHLAEVADLSMRTVQRIERTGDVSMESASALASALNLELAVLMEDPVHKEANPAEPRRYKLWGAFGLIGSAAVALGWWSNAVAEQVMISLSIETAKNTYSNMMLLNEVGTEAEMKLDDQFRMRFNTSRMGEDLLVSARIYHLVNGGSQLISSPAMLIKDQAPVSMKIGFGDGQELNLQLVADF